MVCRGERLFWARSKRGVKRKLWGRMSCCGSHITRIEEQEDSAKADCGILPRPILDMGLSVTEYGS